MRACVLRAFGACARVFVRGPESEVRRPKRANFHENSRFCAGHRSTSCAMIDDYKPKDLITAAVMKLSAAFLFAAMAVQVRYLGDRFSVGQVIFFRAIFAFVPILIFYAALGELSRSWHTKRFTGHVQRGTLSIASSF